MFKVSEAFNKEINKLQGRKFNAKVIIRDKEYSGNQIYEMNLEESVNPSDNFSIGTVCSNTFEIKLINTGDIFDNAIVKPYVGLYIGDDIEYIPLGVFNVIKTSVKGKFINLECVDNMLGLEKVYFSNLSYPADINDIAKEICKKAGVNLASKLPNYRVNKIEGYSLREAIGFIASLCGSFARFNRIGDLEIRGYEVVKQEMTPHNLFKLDIEANECIIKKVIAKKGEEELSTGTDDGNKIVFNNPIITKEILSDIYTKYNGFKYIPYTAKWKGNPAIMAGDILNLTDLKGNKYNALIMEQKFTYKNGISSEVKAKGKTRQDSSFDSKGSVTQSMERYSIEQANIKKALIDKASINDLTAVDAKIQRLYTEDLTAIRAEIVNLNSKKANILELNSLKATLQQAIITKADITDLNSAVGKINVLESKTASIDNLLSQKASINDLNALNATISEALIKKANIAQLEALETKTNNLIADKANITDLNVINANINKVQTETANIKTLLNGNLSSENIQAGGITSDKLVIANGFIKDAMIDSISVNKLNAGIFTTDKFNIRSKDGNLIIKDNTIQIKDSSKVRVQIGKDASGDYSLYVWDKLGNLMFNALGITKDAIKDKIIRNDMVSDEAAIEGKKLNIESVIREVNNGKSNLKASKIDIDTKGQTLDIAFSNLVTENGKNKEEIVSLITKLNVQQGQISASIENSKVLEGKQKTLEDNYNRTVVTVDSLKNTVGQQKTLIDSATGKITSVEVKANTLEKNLSGLTQTVTDTKKVIENNKTVLESKNAELKANIDSVSSSLSSVSSTVDKNNKTLVAKTNTLEQNLSGLSQTVANNKTVIDGKITSVESETHELKAGLGGLTSKLDTLKSTTDGINKTVSNQASVINQLKDSINLKVDSFTFTQSTQTINNNINRAKEQAIIGARSIPDTRSNNENPGWYMQHYAFQTITEFKYANVIGVPNGGSWYGTLETTVPWNNASGGYPTQVFRSNSSPVYQRHGIDLNTWSSWEQIEDTQGSQAKANSALSNAKSYSDSKKQEAIKAAENLALEKSNLAKKYAEDVATAKANLAKTEAIANADGKISAEEKKRIQQAQENLNTAISKADKAKQDAINEANRVAELKKQEAINSANSHADNKANEALNNAKAFVNAEITTVNSHLNKATSEINVLKEKIESKVSQSDIDKSIQEIKIGGRNLALNSSRFELPARNTGTASDNYNYISIDANLLLNSEYTISANVEIVSGSIKEISIYDYPGGKCSRVPIINNRITYTFTKRSNTVNSVLLYAGLAGETRGNSVIFTNVMLEKGNMVSDWSPAPEDTDKLIIDNIKTVTDKITTVESKFTQENNSIKASVQDLNSTTQTITTNVSNINRDLTSKINSNLDAAKSFATDIATNKANTAKQEAINSANSHADSIAVSKANEALNNAKSYTNTEINVVNTKVHNVESNIDILKNKIALKVEQSDIDKTKTELINKINVVDNLANNAKDLASAMSLGKMLFSDPTFKNSSNNIKTYNNNGNGTVTTSRISKINGCPTDSQYCIEVKTVGSASPNYGGFYFGNMTRANAIFVTKIIAKIPVGLRIGWYSNATGNNGSSKWLTSVNGTGKWEEYIHLLKCGDAGNFSSTSFFALDGGITPSTSNPIVWHLAYATVFDITENDESVNVLKTEMSTAKNKVATIETNLDGITQRVSATESKTQTLESNLNGKASKQEIVSINNKVASIETSLSGITNRVSSTESKTSSLEVSINSTNSELNILKNSISTKLEKIDSHIKYGSTNLLINTEFLNNFYNWNKNQYVGLDKYQEKDYVGVMIQNNRIGTEGTLWQRATLKTEVTYTLSFEEYTDDISRWWVGIYYKLNGATKYITLFDSSVNKHSWQKRVFQFKLPSGATETDVSFYNYGGSVGRVWVCNLQLEEGEFATPYKSNPLDFSKFSSAITQTVEGINTEVSKKVNGRDIISTINQSAESVKINASRINLQGYVTVGDLGSTNVTTINNAHITSGTIEGRTMIALNGTGKQNGVLTVNNGESYLEYFRCREAWMMSPYANGWRVPLVHSKYGIKDNESSSDMIDEIAFYRGTDGRNYLQITNTKTGRVEYIELYRSAFDTVTILNRLDRIDAKLAGL
ncbi:hypothetical protein [Clostridium perfringens]|uniref:hypothetical protein n=1 Tax=Clostridium perfringens TaxID=1502 RepID=UPI001FB897C7|nr:hypothetical protein [Clostridium perfringens]